MGKLPFRNEKGKKKDRQTPALGGRTSALTVMMGTIWS